MKNNTSKSFLVLISTLLVICGILYFISPKEHIDGRFFLSIFSLISAQSLVWGIMTDQLSLDNRQMGQAIPVRIGMGTVAAINILGAIAVCWMYLAGAGYSPILVTLGGVTFFLIIAMSFLLGLTKKVAEETNLLDTQSSFMRALRLRVGDLAAKARCKTVIDAAGIKEIDILCDELRYTTVQSFSGCESVNAELLNLISTLESKLASTARIEGSAIIMLIKQMKSALKRREHIIAQLR